MAIFIFDIPGTLTDYAVRAKADYASQIAKQIKSVNKKIDKLHAQLEENG